MRSPMVPPIADNMSVNFAALSISILSNVGVSISQFVFPNDVPYNFSGKVEDLHCTDDGESSEKSHGASNCRQHVHKLCCSVLGDSVKCWSVKVDPHKS